MTAVSGLWIIGLTILVIHGVVAVSDPDLGNDDAHRAKDDEIKDIRQYLRQVIAELEEARLGDGDAEAGVVRAGAGTGGGAKNDFAAKKLTNEKTLQEADGASLEEELEKSAAELKKKEMDDVLARLDRQMEEERQVGNADRPCRGLIVMREQGHIMAPTDNAGYYPNDASCKWLIEAPLGMVVKISFTMLSMEGLDENAECAYDSLTLYDGRSVNSDRLATVCGVVAPDDMVSSGRRVRVVFMTDSNVNDQGFILEFEFVNPNGVAPPESCSGEHLLTAGSEIVTSPGFPDVDYAPNARCSWKMVAAENKVIRLTFTDFAVEEETSCLYDSVTVYDGGSEDSPQQGMYCGLERPPEIISSTNQLYVLFETDYSLELGGFSFTYTFVDTEEGTNKDSAGCGEQKPAVLDHEEGTFTSPGHGDGERYPDNSDCAWRIIVPDTERAFLQFITFDLEGGDYCQYDSVVIYNGYDELAPIVGTYCGNTLPGDVIGTTNVLYVTFVSDISIRGTGFSATFSGKDKTDGDGTDGGGAGGDGTCGRPEVRAKVTRIVGGSVAVPHSWPWQISMRFKGHPNELWGHWCGGSIIAREWIITAAHCLYNFGTEADFKVRVGEHDQGSDAEPTERTFEVAQLIKHENYNAQTYDNDIALMRLKEPVTYSREVSPVCLPAADVPMNTLCVTTGWGDTMGTGNEQLLNQVNVPVLDTEVCNQREWYGGSITSNMICAGYPEGNKDSCQGDSGGPLVCTNGPMYHLYGLTSWGRGCAAARQPGVYTRVARYLSWIASHTGINAV
nr:MASP-related molecule 2-like protein [Arenicola marina]